MSANHALTGNRRVSFLSSHPKNGPQLERDYRYPRGEQAGGVVNLPADGGITAILSALWLVCHRVRILARPTRLPCHPPHRSRRHDLPMVAICGRRLRNPEVPAIRPRRSMGLAVPTRAETAAPSLARIRSSLLLHWLTCGSVRRFPSPSRADKARGPIPHIVALLAQDCLLPSRADRRSHHRPPHRRNHRSAALGTQIQSPWLLAATWTPTHVLSLAATPWPGPPRVPQRTKVQPVTSAVPSKIETTRPPHQPRPDGTSVHTRC